MDKSTEIRHLDEYIEFLKANEYAEATVKKYERDIRQFIITLNGRHAVREDVISYKQSMISKYKASGVNSKLAALNGFFRFTNRSDFTVRRFKVQRQLFRSQNRELTKNEYKRLIDAAQAGGNIRLSLIIQTIGATGIRISELKFITRESIDTGRAEVYGKGKSRSVILPYTLCRKLMKYCKANNINQGSIFITKNGNPVDRSNIWAAMKKLCQKAQVNPDKVFPHNLRHLFARCYYNIKKDLNRLADMLGHSNIETTRIYTVTAIETLEKGIESLGLVV